MLLLPQMKDMKMIKQRRFDIPFGSDFWISVVVGLMLFLTSFCLLVSIGANRYIQDWHIAANGTFSVEIPPSQGEFLQPVVNTLKSHPDVQDVYVLDKSYVEQLMMQIGVSGANAPVLIDFVVPLEKIDSFESDALLVKLQAIVSNVNLIKPALVAPESLAVARLVESLSFGFGLTVLLMMCIVISFVCYSEIQAHSRTIRLFNLLGAPNKFIVSIFQKYISIILLKSLFLTLVLSFVGYYVVDLMYVGSGLYLGALPAYIWVYVVLGVPILITIMVRVIVPTTILKTLHKNYNIVMRS